MKKVIVITGGLTVALAAAYFLYRFKDKILKKKTASSETQQATGNPTGGNSTQAKATTTASKATTAVRTPQVGYQLIPNFKGFNGKVTNVSSSVNVRKEPNVNSPVVTSAKLNEDVLVTGLITNGSVVNGSPAWYATNKGGFIHATYIRTA